MKLFNRFFKPSSKAPDTNEPQPSPPNRRPPDYDEDYLTVWNKKLDFLTDEKFKTSYAEGIGSGHKIGDGGDLGIRWRVHVICWAARMASKIEGDFVECGVNTGIFSLAAMTYTDFDQLGKKFYLFDTFDGVPEDQMTDLEKSDGRVERYQNFYFDCYELAQNNFKKFHSAVLVRGKVPDTLTSVSIDKVAYLSIDMNIAYPELSALNHFWPKLSPGGMVVLDDYAWMAHSYRKRDFDNFAAENSTEILTLPTGQGLMIKA